MKRAVSLALFVVCIAFSVASISNVVLDNAEVEAAAREVACAGAPGEACKPHLTRMSRDPFGQTFEFSALGKTTGVRCARSLYVVGDYGCAPRL